jgi:hypothetical protein
MIATRFVIHARSLASLPSVYRRSLPVHHARLMRVIHVTPLCWIDVRRMPKADGAFGAADARASLFAGKGLQLRFTHSFSPHFIFLSFPRPPTMVEMREPAHVGVPVAAPAAETEAEMRAVVRFHPFSPFVE